MGVGFVIDLFVAKDGKESVTESHFAKTDNWKMAMAEAESRVKLVWDIL